MSAGLWARSSMQAGTGPQGSAGEGGSALRSTQEGAGLQVGAGSGAEQVLSQGSQQDCSHRHYRPAARL